VRIERALAVPTRGGYFNEDLAAIRAGAPRDGFVYTGPPVSPGFSRINEPSEAISIVLVLDNGVTVCGDAMSVEYSAAAGRRGRFQAQEQLPYFLELCNELQGQPVTEFVVMADALDDLPLPPELHRSAAFYGISQALLQAVAIGRHQTAAEVLAEELGTELMTTPIPINVQSGEDRYGSVDKMVLKRADVLPHGLINEIEGKLGRRGELLAEYVSWVVSRIQRFGDDGYAPELHFDVYGMLGTIFDNDPGRIADYLLKLERRAAPYPLCIETPVLMDSRDQQIEALRTLRRTLRDRGGVVQIVVDEWANEIGDIRMFVEEEAADMVNVKSPDLGSVANAARAILECWSAGARPILGGSCTDTDQSARVMAHVALATRPAWVLARPGMGVDEGLQIVHNEMTRTLALIAERSAPRRS
jgi:methylaspartate ammonia-lyase